MRKPIKIITITITIIITKTITKNKNVDNSIEYRKNKRGIFDLLNNSFSII